MITPMNDCSTLSAGTADYTRCVGGNQISLHHLKQKRDCDDRVEQAKTDCLKTLNNLFPPATWGEWAYQQLTISFAANVIGLLEVARMVRIAYIHPEAHIKNVLLGNGVAADVSMGPLALYVAPRNGFVGGIMGYLGC